MEEILEHMVIVGGSYTQGSAIPDSETFAWRLQQNYRHLKVHNYGVGAFGTYQSLLILEQKLPALQPTRMVIYGFIEHHDQRNIGEAGWLQMLGRGNAKVKIPYATIDKQGLLVRHEPQSPIRLPMRNHFVLPLFLEYPVSVVRFETGPQGRSAQKEQVTERLILEMDKLSSEHGADFALVILEASSERKKHLSSFLKQHEITTIDCAFPLVPTMVVTGDGHPNGLMNKRWSECIRTVLDKHLAQ